MLPCGQHSFGGSRESASFHSLPRHRSRHPRPLDGLPPGEGAAHAWSRLGQRHPRRRQDRSRCRRIGHRLRRRPQQLLPARDVRADAGVRRGVGVGSRGLRVQPGRLHRPRPGAPGVGPHAGLRAAPADRLPVRAHPRRGRGRRPHEGALPRLARKERDGLPARAAGRVRVQPRLGAGPRRQVRVRGRHDPVGRRGHRLRVAERPGRHRGRDRARGRSRSSTSSSPRARGRSTSGACSTCP